MLRVSANSHHVTWPGVYESRRALGRMGAPFGQYLLDDVLAGRVHAKLYVFLNPWNLTDADRAKLIEQTRGAARIWCVPPGTGSVATNLVRDETGVSYFYDKLTLTSDYVREAARAAGVHLFTQTNCNVYANAGYVALHASQDGAIELDTGNPGEVVDVLTGEKLGRGPKLVLPMKRADTRVLQTQP